MTKSMYCVEIAVGCFALIILGAVYKVPLPDLHRFATPEDNILSLGIFLVWLGLVFDFLYITCRRLARQYITCTGKPSLYKKITTPFYLFVTLSAFYWWMHCIYRRLLLGFGVEQ